MSILQDKVVVITGAGGGLGKAYAEYMAARGAKIVINDVGGARDGDGTDAGVAEQSAKALQAQGYPAAFHTESIATMSGAESLIKTAVEAFGRIDILINNAGILRDKTMIKLTEQMWDSVIAVHLKGTFACSQAAALQMKAQKESGVSDGGVILNTTSYAGLKGNFGQSNYAAAKAGIYALTLVNSMELAKYNIRVNAVAPIAKTRMTEELAVVPDEMTPEHVAPVAAYLVSSLSEGVTGRVFGVHGEQVFEYKMQMTDGKKADWTPEMIHEELDVIGGSRSVPSAPASAPAAAPAAGPIVAGAVGDKVAQLFNHMPAGFQADKVSGWNAVLHWEIAGSGEYTITVKDGTCKSEPGKVGSSTCVVKTDKDTFLGIVDGSVDGNQAYMQGKISASNVGDLMKYTKAIDAKKALAALAAAPPPAAAVPAGGASGAVAAPAVAAAPQGPSKLELAHTLLAEMPAGARLQLLMSSFDAVAGPRKKGSSDEPALGTLVSTCKCGDNTYVLSATDAGVVVGLAGDASSADISARIMGTPSGIWQGLVMGRSADAIRSGELLVSGQQAFSDLCARITDKAITKMADVAKARGTALSPSIIDHWAHGDPVVVSAAEIVSFSEASGEKTASHCEVGRSDLTAPPLFPVRHYNKAMEKIVTNSDLGIDMNRLLFGEMTMNFHRLVRPKDLIAAKARIDRIEEKSSGQILRVSLMLMCEGESICDGEAGLFIRYNKHNSFKKFKSSASAAKNNDTMDSSAWTMKHSEAVAENQSLLFADAGNDPNPIHTDPAFAKAVGLPGIILHGLCTMAFCGRALIAEIAAGDATKLASLSVRFEKPVIPGQSIQTQAIASGLSERESSGKNKQGRLSGSALTAYDFVANTDADTQVIGQGRAVFRS